MIKRITAIVILLVIAAIPSLVAAEPPTEYEIADGYFYTQGNGLDSSNTQKGYRLTNEDGIPFYTEFRRLGGVPVLGYPISQRFKFQERTTQLTQRAVLQWDDAEGKVIVFDTLDYLSERGWDDWLKEYKSIPRRLITEGSEDEQDPDVFEKTHMALLDQDPQIKSFYQTSDDPIALYGLPMSDAEDLGPFVVMRFEKMVLQRWEVDTDWANAGDITPVNVGEIVKDLGILPDAPLVPEDAPEPAPRRAMASGRGSGPVSRGIATWYGASFQGQGMRNGEAFNMYDPTIAASNTYPLGTKLRVTSSATGNSVIVRVSDTGAFRHPVIIDLSWAAFREIANPSSGVVNVTVEPLRDQ